tara:strand:- start:58 stop:534 length:477 start_codon:yes stop_codon:yes gene_type:complete
VNYVIESKEKKESIARHLNAVGIRTGKELSGSIPESFLFSTVFFFPASLCFLLLSLFFPEMVKDHIESLSILSVLRKESLLRYTPTILAIIGMLSLWKSISDFRKYKRKKEKTETLRVLLDYMRIDIKHFRAILDSLLPDAKESERNAYAQSVFSVQE